MKKVLFSAIFILGSVVALSTSAQTKNAISNVNPKTSVMSDKQNTGSGDLMGDKQNTGSGDLMGDKQNTGSGDLN